MALKQYRPTSPGRRHMTGYDFSDLTGAKPHKALVKKLTKSGGHNATGRYTARRKTGGTSAVTGWSTSCARSSAFPPR